MIPWAFVILLCIGMTIHIALGLYSRRFKGQSVQLPFEILMYICAVWCATFIFDISSESLAFKVLMMQVRFMAVSFIALDLLLIALFFSGHRSWLTTRRLSLLLVIPVITVVLALTTRYSTVFRFNYSLMETSAGFSVLGFTSGPWSSFIYYPYTYILELVTFLLLLQVIFGSQRMYARQALLFFIAVLIPVLMDIFFTLGISPVQGYNMVPSTFAFTGILLAIALFEYRFIDIMPIARTTLFEEMTDPMLVIDPNGRLVDINPAAEQVLGLSRTESTGMDVLDALAGYPEIRACIEASSSACSPVEIRQPPENRIFEIVIQEMGSGGGIPPAKLVILRDVSDRMHAEETLSESEEKYRALFQNLQIGVVVHGPDTGILFSNPGATQILGLTADQMRGKTAIDPSWSFIREDGMKMPPDEYPVNLALGSVEPLSNMILGILRPDREGPTWVQCYSHIIRNPDDTPRQIVITFHEITAIRQAEEALRTSELKLNSILNNISDVVWSLSWPEMDVYYISPSAEQVYGRPVQEFIDRPSLWAEIVHPDDKYLSEKALEDLKNGGSAVRECRIVRPDGSIVWINDRSKIIHDEDGIPVRVEGITSDITGRKKAEEALRETTGYLQNLIDYASAPIIVWSPDFRITRFNHAFENLTLRSEQDMLGRPIDILFPEESRDSSLALIKQTIDGEQWENIKIPIFSADGTVHTVLWNSANILDTGGELISTIAQGIDITQSEKTEETLRNSEERFRTAFDDAAIPMTMTSPDGHLVRVNHAFCSLLGYSDEELLRKSFADITYPDDLGQSYNLVNEAVLGGRRALSFEKRYVRKDGTLILAQVSSMLLKDTAGKPLYFITHIQDITGRKRAEEALRESEVKYREFFTTSRDSVFITTPEGRWIDFNDTALEMFGFSNRAELMERPLTALYEHQEQRAELLALIEREGYVKEYAVRLVKKDGSVIDTVITAVPLLKPDGSIKAFTGSIRDVTELKQAELLLRHSEEKFRETVKLLDEGYYSVTPGGILLEHNIAFNRILGFDSSKDLAGIQTPDFWEDPGERTEYMETLMSKGSIQNYVINAKTVHGEHIVVLANSHLVRDENGILVRIDGTVTDFTELRRAEEELRESEEKFSTAFKTAPYAITITRSKDGSFIDVNDAFTQIAGYTHEEALANSSIGLDLWVDPEDRKRVISSLFEGTPVTGREFHFRRRDGGIITGLFSARIVTLNNEPCILSSISDISDRKQAEERLHESEVRFRTMADWTYDWEYWIDQDRNIVYMSPSVERLTGYPVKDFIADRKLVDRLVHPDDREIWDAHVHFHSQPYSQDDPIEIEYRIVSRDGAIRWISHTCRTICSEHNTCLGTRVSSRDITGQKNAERERERLFADLEQKNAELERFAYTASHDLKTPLITIRGFLGFVGQDARAGDMERLHQDLARIENATVKMQELLDSLLELSKIGRITGPPEPVSMRIISIEAAELLSVPIHERNVTLTIAEDLPDVYGDKKRLLEVMVNLIENAVKFMGDQPEPFVEIGARYGQEKPVFFVRDNGIGIPVEYQGRLFTLFERIEVNVPGTGVGLALVKRIIEFHGGKIWLESEGAGKGTTFWFTLPGVPEEPVNNHKVQE